jgi:hypothetical protein
VGFEVVVVQAVGEKMQVVEDVKEIQQGEKDHIPLASDIMPCPIPRVRPATVCKKNGSKHYLPSL